MAAGVVLALCSTFLAAYMISDTGRRPEIPGIEHLAIFSMPSRAKPHAQPSPAIARTNATDYTPVGAIGKDNNRLALSGFRVLGVSQGSAFVREPHGAVLRVAKGGVLPEGGRVMAVRRQDGQWFVITERGVIGER
jgi:hypothetical protein